MKIIKTKYVPASLNKYDPDEISVYSSGSLRIRLKRGSAGELYLSALTTDRTRWRVMTAAEVQFLREISSAHLGYWLDEVEVKKRDLARVD